jgi:chromosome segregation ATPase
MKWEQRESELVAKREDVIARLAVLAGRIRAVDVRNYEAALATIQRLGVERDALELSLTPLDTELAAVRGQLAALRDRERQIERDAAKQSAEGAYADVLSRAKALHEALVVYERERNTLHGLGEGVPAWGGGPQWLREHLPAYRLKGFLDRTV